MNFDRVLYRLEMRSLVDNAVHGFQRLESADPVLAISIWTDPNAACSAVSIETLANSAEFLGTTDQINDSPADFLYRDLAETHHESFARLWEEHTDGRCWDALGPALIEIGEEAVQQFNALPREDNAILAVNSCRDWFDNRWPL